MNSRYASIKELCSRVSERTAAVGPSMSDRIDRVVTHPIWGWVTVIVVMALLFEQSVSVQKSRTTFSFRPLTELVSFNPAEG